MPAAAPSADAVVAGLVALLELRRGCYEVEVIRPHASSAPIVMVTPEARFGKKVVIKIRGEKKDGPMREEAFYRMSAFLGLRGVVAPCAAAKIVRGREPDTLTLADDVALLVDAYYKDIDDYPPPFQYCTVEEFVANPGSRFSNKHGMCDVALAYLSTPDGRFHAPEAGNSLCSSNEGPPGDRDFATLVHEVLQGPLERLILASVVGCQRDGGGPNLAIGPEPTPEAGVEGGEGGPSSGVDMAPKKLMSIDNTMTFGDVPEDEFRLSLEDSDERYAAYWYPAVLAFPGALRPASDALRALVASWDPVALESFLAPFMFRGGEPAPAPAGLAARRAAKVQELLAHQPDIPLKALAFAVVPSFARDFDTAAAEGELGPLPSMQEDILAGRPRDAWVKTAWNYRAAYNTVFYAGSAAAAVAAAAGVAWAVGRVRRS